MGGKGSGRGSGGARSGAGRPHTYRRIQLDAEAARQLGALLAMRRQECPEAQWTASALLSYLIAEVYAREPANEPANEPARPKPAPDYLG